MNLTADAFIVSVLFSPRIWKTVSFTVAEAFASAMFALIIGLPAAFLVARRRFFGRRFLNILAAVPFCMPTLLIALGFVMFYGMNGVLNAVFSFFRLSRFTALYSFWGIVLTHGFYNFPIVMRMCADTWCRLPSNEADAARLLGADEIGVFRTVTLYQLAPSIGASFTLVFLYCFFSFIIVLLFGSIGGTTIEVEIYQAARSQFDIPTVFKLAFLETAVALVAIAVYSKLEQYAAKSSGMNVADENERKQLFSISEKVTVYGFVVFILIFFAGPLITIAVKAFSAFSVVLHRSTFFPSLMNTLISGCSTAFWCTVLGLLCATFVHVADPLKKKVLLRSLLPMLPMTISPVAAGVFIVLITGQGTVASLVTVQTLLFWPFAYRQITAALDRIPRSIEEAAKLLSPRRRDMLYRVYVPLCSRGLISAFAFSFAVSAGDASLPLMLSIPDFDTLALFTYRLAGAYRFSEACAAGIVLAVLTAGVFSISTAVFTKKKGKIYGTTH